MQSSQIYHKIRATKDLLSYASTMSNANASDIRTWESLLSSNSPTLSNNAAFQQARQMSPPPRPTQGHARSLTSSSRNPHRLTLSFPIQPPDVNSLGRATPTSSEPSTASLLPAANISAFTSSPEQDVDFMVVLAAQERRVLELKEELHHAEAELGTLKSRWALHEASKKRAEIRNVEQLRTLQSKQDLDGKPDEDSEDDIVRRSVELDRRKAMLIGVTKDPKRKVISGGHTRALSLLSPERSNGFHTTPFSVVHEKTPLESNRMSRSTTIPDNTSNSSRVSPHPRTRHSYQDTASTATVGVKQIVDDLRAGLWTFAEDLRQATIGTEALQNPLPRLNIDSGKSVSKRPSRGSLGTNSRQQTATRNKSTSSTRQAAIKHKPTPLKVNEACGRDLVDVSTPRSSKKTDSGVGVDDDWSNWDSPVSARSPGWVDGFSSAQVKGELPAR